MPEIKIKGLTLVLDPGHLQKSIRFEDVLYGINSTLNTYSPLSAHLMIEDGEVLTVELPYDINVVGIELIASEPYRSEEARQRIRGATLLAKEIADSALEEK